MYHVQVGESNGDRECCQMSRQQRQQQARCLRQQEHNTTEKNHFVKSASHEKLPCKGNETIKMSGCNNTSQQ